MDSFDALPLAAIVDNQFFCVHGGISSSIQTIEDVRKISRFREPPESGPMCDILWADPMEPFNSNSLFAPNETRGCSEVFSHKAACQFLNHSGLLSIIRAHEAQDQGYRMYLKNDATGFPSVITMFSAPNYLDSYNNKAAVLRYENNVMNIRQFVHTEHPYWLPNFTDVFTWSIPFVSEKIAELLLVVYKLVNDEKEEIEEVSVIEKEKRRQILRNKVKAVSKMVRMYGVLRKEQEVLLKLKELTPEHKIPKGLLTEGIDAIKEALGNFEKAKDLDKNNEKRPNKVSSFGINDKLLRKSVEFSKEREEFIQRKTQELKQREKLRSSGNEFLNSSTNIVTLIADDMDQVIDQQQQ